jgi:hypothetical protein
MARAGFWLHYGTNHGALLVAYADDLAKEPGGRPGVIMAPVGVTGTVNRLFQESRKGDAIVDPSGHILDLLPHGTQRGQNFPWLNQAARPVSQQQWETWMNAGVDHQLSPALRGTGPEPSFIITPSPLIRAAGGTSALYVILDAANAVRAAHAPARNLWMGLTVDRDYLRDRPHQIRLANMVVGLGAPGLVLRAFHRDLPPISDLAYLTGLREVTYAAATASIDLLLPCSGWLGWLAMAWGAWGFSAGLAGTTWADREPGRLNQPDEPPNYFFEHQLLRPVRWTDHEALARRSDYIPCTCPECSSMGSSYDKSFAQRHHLWWANREAVALTALPTVAQRQAAVAARLADAITYRDGLPDALKRRVDAGFLDTWQGLV